MLASRGTFRRLSGARSVAIVVFCIGLLTAVAFAATQVVPPGDVRCDPNGAGLPTYDMERQAGPPVRFFDPNGDGQWVSKEPSGSNLVGSRTGFFPQKIRFRFFDDGTYIREILDGSNNVLASEAGTWVGI